MSDAVLESSDWGNFAPALQRLEAEEKAQETEAVTEHQTDSEPDNSAAIEALLHFAFLLFEKGTSMLHGVSFKFDEESRRDVTQAAIPVLHKHNAVVSGWMGNYIEEGTLLIAVLSMVIATRDELKTLKKAKQEAQQHEQEKKRTAEAA
jgi:hypothetical protein